MKASEFIAQGNCRGFISEGQVGYVPLEKQRCTVAGSSSLSSSF